MTTITNESWVALPRTLARRLYELPHPAFKLYVYCYLNARFGNHAGLATISIFSMAEMLGAEHRKIKRALLNLENAGLVEVMSRFRSQHDPLDIRIQDFSTISEILAKNESFVPLSRGLNDHFSTMGDLELKILIFGIVEAKYVGKEKGQFSTTARELAKELGSNRDSVNKAINSLIPRYLEPYETARNRYQESTYLVRGYKTKEDFLAEPDIYRSPDGRIAEEMSYEESFEELLVQPWM